MTTTTTPTFAKEIRYSRETRDFDMLLDGQYIGSRGTYHQAEIDLNAHVFDLLTSDLTSDLVIPATVLDGVCGDCGAMLDSMGLCGCRDEEVRIVALCVACAHDAALRGSLGPKLDGPVTLPCAHCGETAVTQFELKDRLPAWLNDTPRHIIACICGEPGVIIHPHGTYCGACHEAADLWRLWKTDSTEFVAELRRQSCRLAEMAERLVTYLNAKNGSALGADSILAMWRQLLGDEPPKPRTFVAVRVVA